jgi:Phage integrase family/NAD(P)-binding Rossmann-like domain
MSPTQYDAVVVGSGPNGLTAAVSLARDGWRVLVVEASDTVGGGTRTELTLPGFRHDVCSAIHPLGYLSPALKHLPLDQHGLEWAHPQISVAHPLDGGPAVRLALPLEETAAGLGSDGRAYRKLIGPFLENPDDLLKDLLTAPSVPRRPLTRGADVLLRASRITIHEEERRVKTQEAVRDLPIPRTLRVALGQHLVRVDPGPADFVFPGDYQNYGHIRRVWDSVCESASIHGARPHDARHTFAVHAAMAGIPLVRLQKLLGHATAAMTMRYMKHAPEAFLDEDAACIERQMTGRSNQEAEARAQVAQDGLRSAKG